jgi:hypothetical protein
MLTGAPPYPAATWEELERALAAERRPALTVPGLPAGVAALCLRCLSRDPIQRPTAAEAATILGAGTGASAGLTRRRAWLAVAVLLALAAVPVVLLLRDDSPKDDSRGAAPVPTVSILVSFAPPPSGAPGATSTSTARPTSRPSTGASASPAPGSSPQTPQAAGKVVLEIVDRYTRSGDIRSDAALDIRNQVNNLISDDNDAARRVEALRHNLTDRVRDHAISDAAYEELDAAVVNFGRALAA